MYISRLALDHYRSWSQVVVDFVPGVNIMVGRNGLGKTNLVEAVEVLSTGASHRTSGTLPLIERGQSTATIRANVVFDDEPVTYEASIHARGANRARVNSGKSLYLRDIVGRIPSVSFTPEDQRLVAGDPGSRRSMLNQAGALLEPGYAAALQQFTRIGKQRATLLKQLGANANAGRPVDAQLSGLEIWTGQFIETGMTLTRMRARVIELLAEPFASMYEWLSDRHGQVRLAYAPSFEEVLVYDDPHPAISEHFQRIYPGEVARGVNLIGPQRDDLQLDLDGMAAREFASNGEMWTMALALKMALFHVVRERLGIKPIVILDDVFAQLDDGRRRQILDFADGQDQVLITVAAEGDVPTHRDAHLIDVGTLVGPDANESAIMDLLSGLREKRMTEPQWGKEGVHQPDDSSASSENGEGAENPEPTVAAAGQGGSSGNLSGGPSRGSSGGFSEGDDSRNAGTGTTADGARS